MTELKFRLDPTGFPMMWVEAINAYMHWMPVTKIQFEYFLCAAPDTHFDATWYDQILHLNPRVTPKAIRPNNYWNALLSGITPSETQRFARWCGEGYMVPTLEDWFTAYQSLKSIAPQPSAIAAMGELRERIHTLLTRLESASQTAFKNADYIPTMADQMLMRMGVMEWVETTGQSMQWGGMGQTNSKLHGSLVTPDQGQPSRPTNPEDTRLPYYGFRLIWRPI